MDLEENYQEVLQQLGQLNLAEKSSIQLEKSEPDYVLDIAVQPCEDPLVAAACSNYQIRLLVRSRLTPTDTLTGHTSTVTGVAFGKTDTNLVLSSSKDQTVRCWDTRIPKTKAQVFKAPSNVKGDLLSVDISENDKLLCVGTEKIGEDAMLLFWDRRQSKVLGSYSNCHIDDVTQVCFQPSSDQYLVSGSADGLLCSYDLSETSEDAALQITSNALSAISKVGWCGQDYSCVYCVTTDNMFYSWDALQGDDCCNIENLNNKLGEGSGVEYLVDCIPEFTALHDKDSAILVGGTNSGSVQLISHSPTSTLVFSTLAQGHTATIRCCQWDRKTRTLLTGGEDSLLCLWSMDATPTSAKDAGKTASKIKGKISVTPDDKKPYNKKRKR